MAALEVPSCSLKRFADVLAANSGQFSQRLHPNFDSSGFYDQMHVEIFTNRDAEFGGVTNVFESFFTGFAVATASWNGRDLGDPDSIFVLIQSNVQFHFSPQRLPGYETVC
jgi:hypothetical protein